MVTPVPNWMNYISCVRIDGKLISLADFAQLYRRKGMALLTWQALGEIIKSMEKAHHTCLKEEVKVLANDSLYGVDIYESLSSGRVLLTTSIVDEDEDSEEEDAEG